MRIIVSALLLFCCSILAAQPARKITLNEALGIARSRTVSLKKAPPADTFLTGIKSAYYSLVYLQERARLLKQQSILMDDLDRVAELQYQAGDIDLAGKMSLNSRLASVNTELSSVGDAIAMRSNSLKYLLATDDDVLPADTTLAMYMIEKPEHTVAGGAGYETVLENKRLELNISFKKLQYYKEEGLPLAGRILQTGRARFLTEDIDYVTFTEEVEQAFALQLAYLETLDQYNQTAIQLEAYAH